MLAQRLHRYQNTKLLPQPPPEIVELLRTIPWIAGIVPLSIHTALYAWIGVRCVARITPQGDRDCVAKHRVDCAEFACQKGRDDQKAESGVIGP